MRSTTLKIDNLDATLNRLRLKDGDVLALTSEAGEETLRNVSKGICDHLHQSKLSVLVLYGPPGVMSLEKVNKRVMREHGWVRAEPTHDS